MNPNDDTYKFLRASEAIKISHTLGMTIIVDADFIQVRKGQNTVYSATNLDRLVGWLEGTLAHTPESAISAEGKRGGFRRKNDDESKQPEPPAQIE